MNQEPHWTILNLRKHDKKENLFHMLLLPCRYRIPSPTTSSVDLDDDGLDADDDSVESSSKRIKISKGATLFSWFSLHIYGDIN